MSASLPISNVPFLFSKPSAFAASLVTPARHSSGVSWNRFAASVIAKRIEHIGDEPGLQSVAIAIGTSHFLSSFIGGFCVSLIVMKAPGNKTATQPALASAFTPLLDVYSI